MVFGNIENQYAEKTNLLYLTYPCEKKDQIELLYANEYAVPVILWIQSYRIWTDSLSRSVFSINSDSGSININGNITVENTDETANAAKISLSAPIDGNKYSWIGAATMTGEWRNSSLYHKGILIEASDGATWSVQSQISEDGTRTSTLAQWNSLGDTTIDLTKTHSMQTLRIDNLTGNGTTFHIKVGAEQSNSETTADLVELGGRSSGKHSVQFDTTGIQSQLITAKKIPYLKVLPVSYAITFDSGRKVSDVISDVISDATLTDRLNQFSGDTIYQVLEYPNQYHFRADAYLLKYEEVLDSKPQLSYSYKEISQENGNTMQAVIKVNGTRHYQFVSSLLTNVGDAGMVSDAMYEKSLDFDPLIINYSDEDHKVDIGLFKYSIENPVLEKDGSIVFYLAPPESVTNLVDNPSPTSEDDDNTNCTVICNSCCAPSQETVISISDIPTDKLSFDDLSDAAEIVTTLGGDGAIYSAWMTDLTDLRKRLGEVRYGAQDGVWAKVIAQKDKVTGLTGADFKQKLYGLQIGLDHIVTQNEDRMWLFGANFKYNSIDQKVGAMRYGHGDLRTYGAFLYATYADYKGYYADLVLSIDHYKQKMTAEQTDDTYVHGKYNTWGWGASVEVGKMFSSTQDDEGWGPWYNHWWIEPQAQLAYYWVKGKHFTLDDDMDVKQKNGNSLIGRLGVVIGKKFNYGANRKEVDKRYSQFYVKGGIKHEFLGKQTIYVDGMKFSDKLRGTRVYYGAGVDWNLSDQLRLYAQVERESGHKYRKDYEVSVGLKWQF